MILILIITIIIIIIIIINVASSSDSDEDSGGYETPPDATAGYIEPRSQTLGSGRRDRSYTTNLVSKNVCYQQQ